MNMDETAVSVTRTITASRRVVFSGWTIPDILGSWLIPEGCVVISASVNPQEGGEYRFTFSIPGGEVEQSLFGTYTEFVPNSRIVKTWILARLDEDPAKASVKVLSADFAETAPGVTELRVTHRGEANADTRVHLKEILEMCLEKLGTWAEAQH